MPVWNFHLGEASTSFRGTPCCASSTAGYTPNREEAYYLSKKTNVIYSPITARRVGNVAARIELLIRPSHQPAPDSRRQHSHPTQKEIKMTQEHRHELTEQLSSLVPHGFETDVNLAKITRWKVGGTVDLFIEPRTQSELSDALKALNSNHVPYCIIGETSNLLFDSRGLRGAVVKIGRHLSGIQVDGDRVSVKAGTSVPILARTVGNRGLSGIEHSVGIPGTVGGLVLMNGGSQRKGIGSHVSWVRYINADGSIEVLSAEECQFSYRSSSLQSRQGAIFEVGLSLAAADPSVVVAEMDEIVCSRRKKFPEDLPNCGSTFLSDPRMYSIVGPPGRVIEDAGFKGEKVGGAQVSTQHANFINNIGGATSSDILALIGKIRSRVFELTGFKMDAEARYVSPLGEMVPAHLEADRRMTLA